jgi:hypothetical protein
MVRISQPIPPQNSLASRLLLREGSKVGVIEDVKSFAFGDGDWKEYEALKRRSFCAGPSKSLPASSASSTLSFSMSSMPQYSTTLQNSVITSLSVSSASLPNTPASSSAQLLHPFPTPPPTSSKALFIILEYDDMMEELNRNNVWMFYETKYGSKQMCVLALMIATEPRRGLIQQL